MWSNPWLQIWSLLLKKSLMENFIFCTMTWLFLLKTELSNYNGKIFYLFLLSVGILSYYSHNYYLTTYLITLYCTIKSQLTIQPKASVQTYYKQTATILMAFFIKTLLLVSSSNKLVLKHKISLSHAYVHIYIHTYIHTFFSWIFYVSTKWNDLRILQ